MIRFIDMFGNDFGVELICSTMSATECGFITSRGYRAAKTRPLSDRAVRDEILGEEIQKNYAENFSVYGVRKMHHSMNRAGWNIGRDQTARLMRTHGLQGVRRGKRVFTTHSDDALHRPADLVNRNFPLEALEMANWNTSDDLTGLIHHSDKGSQYVSIRYSGRLTELGVTASVGTVGDSYDNAPAETINGLYKTELIKPRRPWRTVEKVEFATLEWVWWFNNQRLHSELGYRSPVEYETAHNDRETPTGALVKT